MTLKNHLPLLAGANCFCKGSCTCKQFLNQNVRAKEVPFAEALMDSLISLLQTAMPETGFKHGEQDFRQFLCGVEWVGWNQLLHQRTLQSEGRSHQYLMEICPGNYNNSAASSEEVQFINEPFLEALNEVISYYSIGRGRDAIQRRFQTTTSSMAVPLKTPIVALWCRLFPSWTPAGTDSQNQVSVSMMCWLFFACPQNLIRMWASPKSKTHAKAIPKT